MSLWGELVVYSTLQTNCSPSIAIQKCSPISVFAPYLKGHYHPPTLNRFKPWGCLAYVNSPENASKLGPTAKQMRIVVSSDVKFDETSYPAAKHQESNSHSLVNSSFPYSLLHENIPEEDDASIPLQISITSSQKTPLTHQHIQSRPVLVKIPVDHEIEIDTPVNPTERSMIKQTENSLEHQPPPCRSMRMHTEPERYSFIAHKDLNDENDNPSFTVVMRGANKMQWRKAMQDEFDSFTEHNVGTLVDPPPDTNIYGIDFLDTYASVGRADSMRILMALTPSE
ncbi:hypothetical protein CROQUDRAFT_85470 [Cronartium quercuum f. sp. fusiforme G11]|uniref:Uncharacterized protein n=1 Tax=Cronartium quercuum f. sp. fusiforme G11 TaxID=708437 RepID=A0A9P6NZT1_9BASI|nr:hypothetical protein CROQUDRAFT_85470 [Cronartium quercuum f. sp. fusiforme G11]